MDVSKLLCRSHDFLSMRTEESVPLVGRLARSKTTLYFGGIDLVGGKKKRKKEKCPLCLMVQVSLTGWQQLPKAGL